MGMDDVSEMRSTSTFCVYDSPTATEVNALLAMYPRTSQGSEDGSAKGSDAHAFLWASAGVEKRRSAEKMIVRALNLLPAHIRDEIIL